MGSEGGKVQLPEEPRLRATFPKNALHKKIKVGLQVDRISTVLISAAALPYTNKDKLFTRMKQLISNKQTRTNRIKESGNKKMFLTQIISVNFLAKLLVKLFYIGRNLKNFNTELTTN